MNNKVINLTIFLLIIGLLYLYIITSDKKRIILDVTCSNDCNRSVVSNEDIDNFNNFDNEIGTVDGRYIVPNYVHFLRFGLGKINFIDSVCILAALKNQRPDKLFIHTDEMGKKLGKYWNVIIRNKKYKDVIVFKNAEVPSEIFGQEINPDWKKFHGGDVTRLKILMEYGGIFLDNDSYIVRSLNDFRKYEMSLGWMKFSDLANQVIIANKKARFLKKWLESYREYNSSQWYYNAGIKPTKEILEKEPHLIHREMYLLANRHITRRIYLEDWDEWRSHYAFHLLINHQYTIKKNLSSKATYPVKFNEKNIVNYPVTIRNMVYDVYPMKKIY